MAAADLHVHTNASDGTETPAQVISLAREAGLAAIGITDHDTLEGLVPAMRAGGELSVEVIPGVELSTEHEGVEIHILGYLVDLSCRDFLEHLHRLHANRKERALKMVKKLQELGMAISFTQVLDAAGKAAIGRPHIARVLVEEGFVDTAKEAFNKYIGRGCPAYVPRFKYSPFEAVRLILQAGGVPVLAHPGLAGLDEIIPGLAKAGLMGLEVYYPLHTREQITYYLDICAKYGLIPTGGSDYHGAGHKEHGQLAAATVPYATVQKLMKARSRLSSAIPAYIKNE